MFPKTFIFGFLAVILILTGCSRECGLKEDTFEVRTNQNFSIMVLGPNCGIPPEFRFDVLDPETPEGIEFIKQERIDPSRFVDGGRSHVRLRFRATQKGTYNLSIYKKLYSQEDYPNKGTSLPKTTDPMPHREVKVHVK